eukprot:2785839-Prymnesium_polylepis.1
MYSSRVASPTQHPALRTAPTRVDPRSMKPNAGPRPMRMPARARQAPGQPQLVPCQLPLRSPDRRHLGG